MIDFLNEWDAAKLHEIIAAEKRDRAFWAVAASRERERLHRVIRDYEQRLGIPDFASAVVSNQEGSPHS